MYNRVVIKENRRMLIVNVILAVKFDVGIDNKKKKKHWYWIPVLEWVQQIFRI